MSQIERDESTAIREVALHACYYAISRAVPEHELYGFEARSYFDNLSAKLILDLQRHVLTEKKESKTFEVPLTWWDGFKIAHFPKWLRKRYPAKVKRIECTLEILYPDLKVSLPEETSVIFFKVQEKERSQ